MNMWMPWIAGASPKSWPHSRALSQQRLEKYVITTRAPIGKQWMTSPKQIKWQWIKQISKQTTKNWLGWLNLSWNKNLKFGVMWRWCKWQEPSLWRNSAMIWKPGWNKIQRRQNCKQLGVSDCFNKFSFLNLKIRIWSPLHLWQKNSKSSGKNMLSMWKRIKGLPNMLSLPKNSQPLSLATSAISLPGSKESILKKWIK